MHYFYFRNFGSQKQIQGHVVDSLDGDKFCSYIRDCLLILSSAFTLFYGLPFFFNLTLSHEQFFISLNIDGGHHCKLFSSPSDRTAHHACNAVWQL